jgi:hypothetical protein
MPSCTRDSDSFRVSADGPQPIALSAIDQLKRMAETPPIVVEIVDMAAIMKQSRVIKSELCHTVMLGMRNFTVHSGGSACCIRDTEPW